MKRRQKFINFNHLIGQFCWTILLSGSHGSAIMLRQIKRFSSLNINGVSTVSGRQLNAALNDT